jgi:hypothetical protein
MAKACRDIMNGDLSCAFRCAARMMNPDRLAEAINEMLSRIAALMERSVPGQQ